ncbi:transposase IS4 family protein [Desulfatibacillum aliphaticivorans]|uniref:Transposase IS4 family protein n=1 Tax=Desulfatibacillum aliphaticivorans TaxID=218208 RepID=B8FD47_DESAL|nr:IS4 family transposase [Desulfatibacillum aliphaticivorans]ACL06478.1 transposase IS4 family protein [Desulfatibacillum aliphaticivorans]
MNQGKTIFAQVMDFFPKHQFRRCVDRYHGNSRVRSFSCFDQYLCMAFAQLTYRDSLRDIECCLRAMDKKLYHSGFRGKVSRSTLADANENRDWRIYRDLAHLLIKEARELYQHEDFGLMLDETVYALDSSTIDLCLSVFPWAHFRRAKGAIKMHTLLDLHGNIPSFIHITDGKVHDVNVLDVLPTEIGAIYVMDRGYLDYKRLFAIDQTPAFFVVRAKSNTSLRRLYSKPVDKDLGLRCDQTVVFTGYYAQKRYPEKLRKIKYHDTDKNLHLTLLSNHFSLPAFTIAELYRCRWQIELFFKWIKQHLRIKTFFGTSENAVKTQIWIAISVYILVAIMKKRLKIDLNLYTILQILSLTLFEKIELFQLLTNSGYRKEEPDICNQLKLFGS